MRLEDLAEAVAKLDFGRDGLNIYEMQQRLPGIAQSRTEVERAVRELVAQRRIMADHLDQLGRPATFADAKFFPVEQIEDGWYRERRDSRVDHIVFIGQGGWIGGKKGQGPHVYDMTHMPDGNHYSYEKVLVFTREQFQMHCEAMMHEGARIREEQIREERKAAAGA